jgi:hypothetical protein
MDKIKQTEQREKQKLSSTQPMRYATGTTVLVLVLGTILKE